jgi:beta-lactamase superfamily II metal-dependent hydrolase
VPERKSVNDEDLLFHILNVGDGDNIIVEFPKDAELGMRFYGIVDCYDADKTMGYIEKLKEIRPARDQLEFICATHPHKDHIDGIDELLEDDKLRPKEYWDSGFRHTIWRYYNILKILQDKKVPMTRVSSGMEKYYGNVQVTFLAPSIALRNRYGTYGVDVNNASIVLRFENHIGKMVLMKSEEYWPGNVSIEAVRDVSSSVAILTGDAEFESWSHIVDEFPRLESTQKHKPLVKKMINYLNCSVVKVPHHGSMHSAPLDIYEILTPSKAVISAEQKISTSAGKNLEREMFPHAAARIALEESGAEIYSTEGSLDFLKDENGKRIVDENANPGSIIVLLPPGDISPRWIKLGDEIDEVPASLPQEI